jgi:hypothetical protein
MTRLMPKTRRRFEFSQASSNKFWEVETKQTTLIVTFGRLGTLGQTKATKFLDAAGAGREASSPAPSEGAGVRKRKLTHPTKGPPLPTSTAIGSPRATAPPSSACFSGNLDGARRSRQLQTATFVRTKSTKARAAGEGRGSFA